MTAAPTRLAQLDPGGPAGTFAALARTAPSRPAQGVTDRAVDDWANEYWWLTKPAGESS